MMTAVTAASPGTFDSAAAIDTVGGLLAARGFGTRTERVLTITGIRTAPSDLTIAPGGTITWHYHTCGNPPDHERITAIAATVLKADCIPPGPLHNQPPDPGAWLFPHLDFLARLAALAVTSRQLTAVIGILNPDTCTIPDTLAIANPAQPGRGTVNIDQYGTITWTCSIHGYPPSTDGPDLTDIVTTITRAIKTPPTLAPPLVADGLVH